MIDPLATAASVVTVAVGIVTTVGWIWRRAHRAESPAFAPVKYFEIMPVAYTMDLQGVVPSIEVRLYAVNYTGRLMTLTELKITRLSIPDGPPLGDIGLLQEFQLHPHRVTSVICRRNLADSEARVVPKYDALVRLVGSFSFVARAKDGRREYTFGPRVAQAIEGGINRPTTSPG
jgi:hypothetical protein